ncbi:MAG: AI-2E family transporter [Flavobacteriia bacterium]|nr:MAG: AI-2E family transporter [Flavobacteriia bacterium]
MTSKELSKGIIRAVGVLAGIALFLFFLYEIQSVLVYLAIAAVLSLIARPIMTFLKEKLKLPNLLAVIITMSLFILAIFGIISMFIPLIVQQGYNISLLNTSELHNNIKALLTQINQYFSTRGIDITNLIKDIDLASNLKIIPSFLNAILSTAGSISMGLFSVLFILFFFLKDKDLLHQFFLAITPDGKEQRLMNSLNKINKLLSRYFIGLIIQIAILFTIYSIILLASGIESALVIAFLAAILNIIPYVGPLIGGILMLTLTMTSNLEYDFQTVILPTTLWVFVGYIVAQMIDNFFSQPIIFSKSVKSHPLEIFLIIIIGGLTFGIAGMIIAVPTYTALKVIFNEYYSDNQVVKQLTKYFN